jgi:hypothetical protein
MKKPLQIFIMGRRWAHLHARVWQWLNCGLLPMFLGGARLLLSVSGLRSQGQRFSTEAETFSRNVRRCLTRALTEQRENPEQPNLGSASAGPCADRSAPDVRRSGCNRRRRCRPWGRSGYRQCRRRCVPRGPGGSARGQQGHDAGDHQRQGVLDHNSSPRKWSTAPYGRTTRYHFRSQD